jgi:predicted glycoside hydrolase/deacetylase ChbG (UPF0249 family)
VIINADDLGTSLEVNRQIFDLLGQGRLTSATILANGPAIEDALRTVGQFSKPSFGVHLNCTQFKPLTGSPALSAISDPNGSMVNVIRKIRITPSLIQAVYEEWTAQIQRIIATGIRITHIDSHHHTHTIPHFLPVLRRLRTRFSIRSARISMNVFDPDEYKPYSLVVKKSLYNVALRYFCGFRTPDACTNFETFLHTDPSCFRGMKTIELMAHPGHPSFDTETGLLRGPWIKDFPYRLVNYRDL